MLNSYRTAWKEAGHQGTPNIVMRTPIYVAETAERARSEPQASAKRQQEYDARVTTRYAPNVDLANSIMKMATEPYEVQLQGLLSLYGTPEAVTERIQYYNGELDISGLILEINHGGQIPYDLVLNSMRLLTEKVMPNFK